jgi:hypothetical protein
VAGLVTRGGHVLAIAGALVGLADAVDEGVGPIAEAVASGTLGLIGAFAGGPVAWVAATVGFVAWLVTSAPASGPPPPRTYPDGRPNPGGAHYGHTVNGAGVPVAPDGV